MKQRLRKFLSLSASALAVAGVVVPTATVKAEEPVEFSTEVENEGEAIEGGTVHFALVGESFPGLLNPLYYSDQNDGSIINFFSPSLYGYNEAFEIDDSGFAELEFNEEDQQVTIRIPEGTKWDDGEPLTIDDVIFPYYVLSDPDYDGGRLDHKVTNVEGYEAYVDGEADEISGLDRVDDYTLTVTYAEMTPSLKQANGMVLGTILPEHVYEDIPVSEMEDSEPARVKPVGFGPFKVESITPGESVTYVANEHYYKGKPKVDGLVLDVVSPSAVVQELKAGNYDIASMIPTDQYDAWADAENFDVVGKIENSYTYIGFKLGDWDEEAEEVVIDEDRVTNNKALRQAMAYALDMEAVVDNLFHGLREQMTSFTPHNFEGYFDPEAQGYPQDVEKAKEILEEAGFVDVNGDGFVEDPNGEEFVLNYAAPASGDVAEPLAQYYLSAWEEIGVNVQLYNDRLLEPNTYYEEVRGDNPDIDVFFGGMGVGGDPNPNALWSKSGEMGRAWNLTRYTSDEMEEHLATLNSLEMLDDEARYQAYIDWNNFMMEELPEIPTMSYLDIRPVNKRVKYYTNSADSDFGWEQLELTADQPIAN